MVHESTVYDGTNASAPTTLPSTGIVHSIRYTLYQQLCQTLYSYCTAIPTTAPPPVPHPCDAAADLAGGSSSSSSSSGSSSSGGGGGLNGDLRGGTSGSLSGCDVTSTTCVRGVGQSYRCACRAGYVPHRFNGKICRPTWAPTHTPTALPTTPMPTSDPTASPTVHPCDAQRYGDRYGLGAGYELDVCDDASTLCHREDRNGFSCECKDGYEPDPHSARRCLLNACDEGLSGCDERSTTCVKGAGVSTGQCSMSAVRYSMIQYERSTTCVKGAGVRASRYTHYTPALHKLPTGVTPPASRVQR
jgi:hypothetical protein